MTNKSTTLDQMMSDSSDEDKNKESWAILNQMLKEAKEGPNSDRTIDEIFDSVLLERGYDEVFLKRGYSQHQINQLRLKYAKDP